MWLLALRLPTPTATRATPSPRRILLQNHKMLEQVPTSKVSLIMASAANPVAMEGWHAGYGKTLSGCTAANRPNITFILPTSGWIPVQPADVKLHPLLHCGSHAAAAHGHPDDHL